MALSWDNTAGVVASGTGNLSWTHTGAASNVKAVIVQVVQNIGTNDQVTNVTYGTLTLTRVSGATVFHANAAAGKTGAIYTYVGTSGIPQGAQTVTVTVTASGNQKDAHSYSLIGAADTAVDGAVTLDTSNVGVGASASVTIPAQSVVTALAVGALHSGATAASGMTAGAGTSEVEEDDFGNQTASFTRLTNATSGSITYAWTVNANTAAGVGAVAIAEMTAGAVPAEKFAGTGALLVPEVSPATVGNVTVNTKFTGTAVVTAAGVSVKGMIAAAVIAATATVVTTNARIIPSLGAQKAATVAVVGVAAAGTAQGGSVDAAPFAATAAIPVPTLTRGAGISGAVMSGTGGIPSLAVSVKAGVTAQKFGVAAALLVPALSRSASVSPTSMATTGTVRVVAITRGAGIAGSPMRGSGSFFSTLPGAKACWTFDDASNRGKDSAGSYDLTGTISTTGGVRGSAIYYYTGDTQLTRTTNDFRMAGDFTILVWARQLDADASPYAHIVTYGDWGLRFNQISTFSIEAWAFDLDNNWQSASLVCPAGAWHFFAARYKAATRTLSLSEDLGAWQDGTPFPFQLAQTGTFIGVGGADLSRDPIDELSVYPRYLSDPEIAEAYNRFHPYSPTVAVAANIAAQPFTAVASVKVPTLSRGAGISPASPMGGWAGSPGSLLSSYETDVATVYFTPSTTEWAQSVMGNGGRLFKVAFKLRKEGSQYVPGSLVARLYAHTGTYGTDGKPNGAALAQSLDTLAADAVVDEWHEFHFTGYELAAGVPYCAALASDGTVSNVGISIGGTEDPGNPSYLSGGSWTAVSFDLDYRVYVEGVPTVGAGVAADVAAAPIQAVAVVPVPAVGGVAWAGVSAVPFSAVGALVTTNARIVPRVGAQQVLAAGALPSPTTGSQVGGFAVPFAATGALLVPSVQGQQPASISSAPFAATAATLVASVQGQTGGVYAQPFTAAGGIVTVGAGVYVELRYPPILTVAGSVPVHTVSTTGGVDIVAAVIAATGEFPDTGANLAPTATVDTLAAAAAALPVPTVVANAGALVAAQPFAATIYVAVPGVSGLAGVSAVKFAATAVVPIPALTSEPTAQAGGITGTAAFLAPSITGGVTSSVSGQKLVAAAVFLSPSVKVTVGIAAAKFAATAALKVPALAQEAVVAAQPFAAVASVKPSGQGVVGTIAAAKFAAVAVVRVAAAQAIIRVQAQPFTGTAAVKVPAVRATAGGSPLAGVAAFKAPSIRIAPNVRAWPSPAIMSGTARVLSPPSAQTPQAEAEPLVGTAAFKAASVYVSAGVEKVFLFAG